MIIIFYIKEINNENEIFNNDFKIPSVIKKILIKVFRITNIMIIKENIILLPYFQNQKIEISDKKFKRIFKKIHKFLEKENIETIAISNKFNELDNNNIFKNLFYANNYNILDGKLLFQNLSYEILLYISKQINKPINEMEISLMSNSNNEFIKENIKLLSQSVKNLNIVTRNIEYFKPVIQELYNSFGISIRISNNKKKILTNSDIIFNFDFPEEIINKFNLPLNSIIINYNKQNKIYNKLFNGLNVHDYTINVDKYLIDDFKEVHLLPAFNLEILYESLYYKETSFTKMITHFINDKLVITSLKGMNGKLSKHEYNNL